MVGARYILRFDDICPTMNWRVWAEIEKILYLRAIRPILAVVPDNQDPELMVGPAVADFWGRVREWQARGWTIALHGFQHRYVNRNGGLLGITMQSEFAGLPRDEQEFKLRAGLAMFKAEGITSQAWIAPSHSFDHTTVELLPALGIRAISDGLSNSPYLTANGVVWVPQQLWERFRLRKQGVWTVCCHHNNWSAARLEEFSSQITVYEQKIASFDTIVAGCRRHGPNFGDRARAWTWRARSYWGPRLLPLVRPAGLAKTS